MSGFLRKNFWFDAEWVDHGLFRQEPVQQEAPVADAVEPILRVEIAPPNSRQSMRALADRIGKKI